MTTIKNASHDGDFGLRVSEEGRAQIDSVSESTDRHLNIEHQQVWSLPFSGIDPVGADDYFLYVKNLGTKNIALTDFRLESSVIGTVEVHSVTGTAVYVAGTDVVKTPRFIGSATNLDATIKTDTDITGLVDEGIHFYINCDTANKTSSLKTTSNVVIPPGQSAALSWDQATGVLKGIVSLVLLEE